MLKIYFAGIIVALSISACSDSSTPVESTDTSIQTTTQATPPNTVRQPATNISLYNREWQWLEGKRNSIGTLPFIQLIQIDEHDEPSTRLVGYGGCNRLHGTADITAQQALQFTHIAITKRICEKTEIMQQESELIAILEQTTKYITQDNQMTLINSDDQLLITLTAKPSSK